MGKIACIFPGQGSQSVGMGLDLVNGSETAKKTMEAIDEIAGRSLSKLCFEGPDEELKRTINTQPTILAVSLAAWNAYVKAGGPHPDFVAGHSLGELSALVAAGSLAMNDAVRLVEKRAALMESCPKGAMSAVLGVPADVLEQCATEAQQELKAGGADDDASCVIVANFNTRDQLVISGSPDGVKRCGELAKTKGGKVIPLPVGGAFHSPLMRSAASEFSAALNDATICDAQCLVVQNFDGHPSKSAAEIKAKLSHQMSSAVRWCASVEYMISQGVDTFIEIGPGKVLSGTIKKIDKAVKFYNISDAASLASVIEALKSVPV